MRKNYVDIPFHELILNRGGFNTVPSDGIYTEQHEAGKERHLNDDDDDDEQCDCQD